MSNNGIYYGITKLMTACSRLTRELGGSLNCNGTERFFFVHQRTHTVMVDLNECLIML